jgi:nucleotide-binding universal stress UspA family protein
VGLRNLLVFIDDSNDWRTQLTLAGDLASRHGCRLTAACAPHWSQSQLAQRRTAEIGLASAADVEELDRRVEALMNAAMDAVCAELDAFGQRTGLPVHFRRLESPASVTLPQEARHADLCVLGQSLAKDADPASYTLAETLLFTSGGPVLSIPPDPPAVTLGRHVAVAWNSSRACARSLHDALPLIEAAERVTVITINPSDCLTRPGVPPIERLLEHLKLHGADAELAQLEGVAAGAIGDTLQAKACEVGADMLVAGAFGQPRLWERLLGRATHDLLDRMKLPLQMSS